MNKYSYDNLVKYVNTEVGKQFLGEIKKIYERDFANRPILDIKYSYYKLIYINGDRDKFQNMYYDRRNRMMYLQLLALTDDKYIEDLEDVLNAVCSEFTWILPAHCLKDGNVFDYTEIDLYSSETAFYLSETYYVYKDKLSKDIKNRILMTLEQRIVKNFENRTFFFEECDHNWASVCSCGVGATYLYAFPEKFDSIKERIFGCMDRFLSGLDGEGVCTEGVGYWVYGFGFFTLFFDILQQMTGKIPSALQNEKVHKSIAYFNNAKLIGNMYLPYADGGAKIFRGNASILYTIKDVFPEEMIMPEVDIYETYNKILGFRTLIGINKYGIPNPKDVELTSTYFKLSEIMVCRKKEFVFTAKCGNNAEHHNHNDVGGFEIVRKGYRYLMDPGPALYSWKYFNDESDTTGRYGKEIFVCGSWGHCVPVVNDEPQRLGPNFKGTVLEQSDTHFKLDIAKAYRDCLDSLIVDYTVNENNVEVLYDCKGIKKNITFRFISEIKPVIKDGFVYIADMKVDCNKDLKPEINDVKYKKHITGEDVVVYTIDYKVDKNGDLKEKFIFKI